MSKKKTEKVETEPRYLLADHSRGVDSGEGEVHVGGDHGGIVLVLRLEAAYRAELPVILSLFLSPFKFCSYLT